MARWEQDEGLGWTSLLHSNGRTCSAGDGTKDMKFTSPVNISQTLDSLGNQLH